MCAEKQNNNNIKEITKEYSEYVISQYADDTSLILGWIPRIFGCISLYGTDLSCLNINLDKNNVILLRRDKFSQDTMCVK